MSDRVNSPNYFNPLHLYGLVKRCPFAYILVERPTMEYIFLVSSESIIPIFYALLSMSCPCPCPIPSRFVPVLHNLFSFGHGRHRTLLENWQGINEDFVLHVGSQGCVIVGESSVLKNHIERFKLETIMALLPIQLFAFRIMSYGHRQTDKKLRHTG